MISFNEATFLGEEFDFIGDAIKRKHISGDGYYTKLCNEVLEQGIGCRKALLTHSCTAALEMSAMLLGIQPGDEVICPSYTFVTTASSFALRGAKLVFADIRDDTLNLDENKIEEAITSKTKAIVPVHYAGVSAEMDKINEIATHYGLAVVEDAAQAVGSFYKGKACGSMAIWDVTVFTKRRMWFAEKAEPLFLIGMIMWKMLKLFGKKALTAASFSGDRLINILGLN